MNTLAGGGSFITFPALLAVGVPPVSANATNTFASLAGYLSGAYGFREELKTYRTELCIWIPVSVIAGVIGALLLLHTKESSFNAVIPWLLLFATVLFIFGGRINEKLQRISLASTTPWLILLCVVCVYGGYFNAGLGIILLSILMLAGYRNIHSMNGIKLLLSSSVSASAVIIFILQDAIAWQQGIAVLTGTLLGGYFSAVVAKRIGQEKVRYAVIAMSCAITSYFFLETYFS